MNCKHVEELLPLYVGRDLEEKHARLVKAHVQSCAGCARLAEEYGEAQQLLQLFEPPPFGEAVYAGIRQRVLREIGRESTAPVPPRLVASLFRPRIRWAVATALLLAVSAVALYFIADRRGGRQQVADSSRASDRTRPAERQSVRSQGSESAVPPSPSGEQSDGPPSASTDRNAGADATIAGADDRTYQARRGKGRGAAAARARPVAVSMRDAGSMTAGSSPERNDLAKPGVVAARYPVIPEKTLRVEMQTKDPNIRIIWISHQRAKQDSLR